MAWSGLLLCIGVAHAQPSSVPPEAPAAPTAPPPPEIEVVVLPTIEATPDGAAVPPPVEAPPRVVLTADALAEYRSQFIFLNEEEWLTLTAQRVGDHIRGSVTRNRVIHAKRGEQRESLDGADFYDAVGRPDLADSYRTRRNLYIGGGIAAGALLAYGIYEVVTSLSIRSDTFDNDDCQLGGDFAACVERDRIADQKLEDEADVHLRRALIGGGIGLGVGLIAGAIYKRRHPVSDDERRFLVIKYNRSLRARLGIPEPQILDVGPYAGADGGGVVVTGRF